MIILTVGINLLGRFTVPLWCLHKSDAYLNGNRTDISLLWAITAVFALIAADMAAKIIREGVKSAQG